MSCSTSVTRRLRWSKLAVLVVLLPVCAAEAAGTLGTKKVLGIRVNFKDVKSVPNEAQVLQKLNAAKLYFGSFSYGKLKLVVDVTPVLTLNNNRSTYNASGLASAAEAKAEKAGYKIGSYHIIGFYYSGGSVGAHAIVGGKRFWAPGTGGSTMHEMGHNFGYGHQSRWAAKGSNPIGAGELKTDTSSVVTSQ